MSPVLCVLCLLSTLASAQPQQAAQPEWKPGAGLLSRFAEDLDPASPLPEYPRPQMVRPAWTNLNGPWDYAITPADAGPPETYDGRILVPFPVESALSGVQKPVRPDQRLWYRRTFARPADLGDGRLLLHFGAVDWQATVYVNGREAGQHTGGYDPFSFDITPHLREGENELVVAVLDPTDQGTQPIGKQRLKPEGIFYTAVTGIWQTVWIEPLPAAHIASLQITPDIDAGEVEIAVRPSDAPPPEGDPGFEYTIFDGGNVVARIVVPQNRVRLKVPEAKLWSPDSPHLYDLRVRYGGDEVSSYFAMRKISVGRAHDGAPRLMLNNQPIFMCGPLDQGWWPDGLYTAPTDAALRYDIEVTKQLGFNMARKHVKVEPARWYYWADKLGLLVWQDFPSSFAVNAAPDSKEDPELPREAAEQWRRELRAMIDALSNHPSIVVWVPFNEGWGQHDTNTVLAWVKQVDPTRPVDGPSGWADRGHGDLHDMHRYPGPAMFPAGEERASVLGEFGGLGLPIEGHLWQSDRNWGYRNLKSREELERRYAQLIRELRPLIRQGLAAAVYTQTTDVEGEVNGLMTYDRRVIKIDPARAAAMHAPLYAPVEPTERIVLLPSSEQQPRTWSYVVEPPADDDSWAQPEYADHAWKTGFAGFGTEGTPGAIVRTKWEGNALWLRQRFTLPEGAGDVVEPHLRIHHDEDAIIYLNGTKVAELEGYSTGYRDIPLPPEAGRLLKAGENVIAVHVKQTAGGQYIDVGLFDLRPKAAPGDPPGRGAGGGDNGGAGR